jgi:hypothetical protein
MNECARNGTGTRIRWTYLSLHRCRRYSILLFASCPSRSRRHIGRLVVHVRFALVLFRRVSDQVAQRELGGSVCAAPVQVVETVRRIQAYQGPTGSLGHSIWNLSVPVWILPDTALPGTTSTTDQLQFAGWADKAMLRNAMDVAYTTPSYDGATGPVTVLVAQLNFSWSRFPFQALSSGPELSSAAQLYWQSPSARCAAPALDRPATSSAEPEPSSASLLLAGAVGLVAVRVQCSAPPQDFVQFCPPVTMELIPNPSNVPTAPWAPQEFTPIINFTGCHGWSGEYRFHLTIWHAGTYQERDLHVLW